MLLSGKKILLGITASIASYKSILLLRLLIKEGAEVKVIMTPAAKDFVSPLVLSVLSKQKVVIDWEEQYEWNNHVALGRWADLMLIAPLSCNSLSKMANGGCDNVLMAVYLSATCPVVVVPAMDEDMWLHPSTKSNISKLMAYGNILIDVAKGELASGLTGEGRMPQPEQILNTITERFFRSNIFAGKKILVSAGPTYEALDPVRFIGNRSSGKMGFALASVFYLQGADVVLITGPTEQQLLYTGIRRVNIQSADEMFQACIAEQDADIIVMSAAVADYTPIKTATQKIKKTDDEITLNLRQTKDILKYLGQQKKEKQFIVGFALETENEITNAKQKLVSKNLDCIIMNSLNDPGAGFEKDTNKVTIIDHSGHTELTLQTKQETALEIVKHIASACFSARRNKEE